MKEKQSISEFSNKEKAEIKKWLDETTIEVFPKNETLEKIKITRPEVPISITSSPSNGIGLTRDFAISLLNENVTPIPHLAARNIEDEELEPMLKSFFDLGIKKFLIIAGDNKTPRGNLKDSTDLINAMITLGFIPDEIYIAGYPRKHSFIAEGDRDKALWDKQNLGTKYGINMKIKTQVCLSTYHIAKFKRHLDSIGITLPIIAGLLGPVKLKSANEHLLEVGVDELLPVINRIKSGNLTEDLSILRYKPDDFLIDLVKNAGDSIEGVHFISFGAYTKTIDSIKEIKSQVDLNE